MDFTLSEIATALNAELQGDGSLRVTGAAEPGQAGEDDLALAMSPKWAEALQQGRARVALVWPGADWREMGLQGAIVAPRGRLAMAGLTQLLDAPGAETGIHPSAVVDASAEIGEGVFVGPLAVIGAGAVIGANSRIMAQASIGPGVRLGQGALIHSGARLGRNVMAGDRLIVQPNAVIGGDGFSFVTESESHVESARAELGQGKVSEEADPTWHRIHSLGSVILGDDVEIGACATIDAGTIRPTRVGNGSKIDNLVQVGHNCVIGDHCLLCGHVGLAGSVNIGDRSVLGGKVGVSDNLNIGADVVLTGGSIVLSNVPAGRVMMGYPATKIDSQVESYKALRRLPRLMRDLAASRKG
ncbi:MAG: UDP-3-O-(3-hydroxymyristoyl)glucosamine N-acyltransferase [Limimaricola soesokkakensis]|uniref:UDP-3-O-(3-hydroxymyristoyl)glucosamine N-acyltransferase n=1 Tax=Limimaricola soesokkakensis TaxID=1343159 RepID=UPI0040590E26